MKHIQNFPLINESRSQELTQDKFMDLLESECSYWDISHARLYRGVSSGAKPFMYMNPKKYNRVSLNQEGVNIYSIILNNSKLWEKYPNRNNSIIATNDYTFTSDYAEWVDDKIMYHVIIPFNNTMWGIAPRNDLWFSYTYEELGARQLSEFNEAIHSILRMLVNDNNIEINNLDDLKNVLNRIDYNNGGNVDIIEKVHISLDEVSDGNYLDSILYKVIDSFKYVKNAKRFT